MNAKKIAKRILTMVAGAVVGSAAILTFVGVADPQVVLLTIAAVLFLIPTIVAARRHHKNAAPIFLVNILFGWSVLGWVAALVWSFTSNVKEAHA